jgi:uncharacterized protein GlcG (DUF336 family)
VSEPISHTTDLPLLDARALIDRAIDKAEEIAMRGAVAVIGASGALVSASRMDHGGAGGMARARSKAWIAATQQMRSAEHLKRMTMIAPPMVTGFVACSPEAVFPGAGGMPIDRQGWVVAGIAASGAGIGPFVDYPGADRLKLAVRPTARTCSSITPWASPMRASTATTWHGGRQPTARCPPTSEPGSAWRSRPATPARASTTGRAPWPTAR